LASGVLEQICHLLLTEDQLFDDAYNAIKYFCFSK
jgi:hypothetical protein